MLKTITSSFFTTTNAGSFRDTIIFSVNPWNRKHLRNGKYTKKIEVKLMKYLWAKKESEIMSFYNARSALYHWFKIFDIWQKDEVIIQAYTCVSVANSIIQAWAKPIYCDIDQTLNMDINKIEAKITSKTKAIILQHTFGNPADIGQIQTLCNKHNIFLIEDCAHSLWAEYKSKKVGTFWDFAIFSSWRDKVISTVNWGFLLINNNKYFNKIKEIESGLKDVPTNLIVKNLFYIIISYLSYKLYDFFGLWKALILLARRWKLIPEILSCDEKNCHDNKLFYRLPNALAYIGLREIKKIDIYNQKRIKIAKQYEPIVNQLWTNRVSSTNSIYLRYVFLTDKPKELTAKCKKHKILLWDWYNQVIAPEHTDYKNALFTPWSCPVAEKIASQTVDLPCHPNMSNKDVSRVVDILNR